MARRKFIELPPVFNQHMDYSCWRTLAPRKAWLNVEHVRHAGRDDIWRVSVYKADDNALRVSPVRFTSPTGEAMVGVTSVSILNVVEDDPMQRKLRAACAYVLEPFGFTIAIRKKGETK